MLLPTSAGPHIVRRGDVWSQNNLIWDHFPAVGDVEKHFSPLDGEIIQHSHILSPADLNHLFHLPTTLPAWTEGDVYAFVSRLEFQLTELNPALREATQWEMAFSPSDCEEVVESTISYLRGFPDYYAKVRGSAPAFLDYKVGNEQRRIVQKLCPWGTIAVMMPQNAALLIGVICLLNALVTNNRIVLRAPLQGARTAALLGQAVWHAKPPQNSISIVVAKGRDFLDAAYACPTPLLIHYLGASQFGGDILKNAFAHQKPVLVDGTGNTWVWVSEKSDPEEVVEVLTTGATRYNGQTCTSINGATIHPAIFNEVCQRLEKRWKELRVGDTRDGTPIGGLFDEQQAQVCLQRIHESGGSTLCGGQTLRNLLEPTLVARPMPDSDLVTEGIFAPVLWLQPGTKEEFVAHWRTNRYPLCAGVLEPNVEEEWWMSRLPYIARMVFNGDPSVEHVYEPWGGYPASGSNSVSFWHQKYQRTVCVDAARFQ